MNCMKNKTRMIGKVIGRFRLENVINGIATCTITNRIRIRATDSNQEIEFHDYDELLDFCIDVLEEAENDIPFSWVKER